MPYSKTQICNMSLGHVGISSHLQDVDTESGNEAINCRLYFDICLDLLLEVQEWPFAKRTTALQDLGSPPDGWRFRYKYPNFCALALKIVNPNMRSEGKDQAIPYEIMDMEDGTGKVILCDQENAVLKFNKKLDGSNTNLFTPSFVQGLALLIGAHLVVPLRVDPKLATVIDQRFALWLNEAASRVLREQQPDIERPSQYETVRA